MANQGILAKSKPAAATNTLLYSAPADRSASTVLNVANDGTASNYEFGIKDFDQKLTVDASTYLLHKGDIISGYTMTVGTPFAPTGSGFEGGLRITSTDGEKQFNYESYIIPSLTTYYVKAITARSIAIESVSGTFAVGETITIGSGGNDTTATVFQVDGTTLYIGASTINGTGGGSGTGGEFGEGDAITASGGATATISTGGIADLGGKFVFSTTTSGGTYQLYQNAQAVLLFYVDRVYRLDVSDASMAGRVFALSQTYNGEWGPDGLAPSDPSDAGDGGTEFTTGKTVSGTAGSANAYIEYDFTASTAIIGSLYWYDATLATATNSTYGSSGYFANTGEEPVYDTFYVYDVSGTWVNSTDTFTLNSVTYTVTAQSAGAYGVVRDYSGTTLKVILGPGSQDFAGTDTFIDNPFLLSATRSTVTVSSVDVAKTALEAENYIKVDVANASNNVDKYTSLVIGPGERLVVKSTTQNNVFNLIGFEDTSTALPTRAFLQGNESPAAGGLSGGGS